MGADDADGADGTLGKVFELDLAGALEAGDGGCK